jgi:hypothetical protein
MPYECLKINNCMQHGVNYGEGGIDTTPVKRARLQQPPPPTNFGKVSPTAVSMAPVITAPLKAFQASKASKERVEKLQAITQARFGRALRTNNGIMLARCIESGYSPSLSEWLHIIGKLHVTTSLKCVQLVPSLGNSCLGVAIKRQHRQLFQRVIDRVERVSSVNMEYLLTVPAVYLDGCLKKGMDPNLPLKNRRLPLEYACAHSRLSHIEMLLNDPRIQVSQTVCRFLIRQPKQQRFSQRAIELCDDIVATMILEAVVANVNPALIAIMTKLEPTYQTSATWDELTHLLMCPILNDYSTDMVKTINNHYFDRDSLLTWVHSKHTDPLTREPLEEADLQVRAEFLQFYATALQLLIQKL